jgi:transcriptional regulator GlxA family with amidase domain
VPGFPLVPYSAAIETLRMANNLQRENLYTWETVTISGHPVAASSGLEVIPKRAAISTTSFSSLFVCGGIKIRDAWKPNMGGWLQMLAKKKIPLGALSTGSYLLAKAGLLEGYRCAIHWDRLATTREEFPNVQFSNAIYEIDRDRYTCAGGITAIDMMLHLISLDHGKELDHEIGTSQPRLTEAAILMAANLEEPLSIEELASYVGVSRRQLERLFRCYLDRTPTQYYIGLRLKDARRLLMQTEKSITEISIYCGFASAGHFSKCYRDEFGLPPRADRKRLLALNVSG